MEIPSPDLTHVPRFINDWVVVETLYGDDNWVRVLITKDGRNIYRIHPERWDISDLTIIGHGYWSAWGHSSSFTDDIQIARTLAEEALRAIPRSSVIAEDEV
jgi:hypothetical protein